MGWLLRLLESLGRKRIIYDRITGEPYLERYYLLFRERSWFPFNMFIHKFLASDPSDLHDHPWNYFTFVLKGGYFEWSPDEDGRVLREWLGPWRFRFRRATSRHRIELMKDVECWTLFIPLCKSRRWGFWHDDKFIDAEEYAGGSRENTDN